MKELQPRQQVSPEKARRIAFAAATGAVVEGADEYLRQRRELKREIPPKDTTLRGRLGQEVVIFERVDKRRVGKAALRGAVIFGAEEALRKDHQPRP